MKRLSLILLIGLAVSAAAVLPAQANTPLSAICRIKGQEENTLHAMGLVVGLNGTGDGGNFMPTIRTFATILDRMGTAVSRDDLTELKNAKNVALVYVTVTVPSAGARQGDRIDCVVSAVGSSADLTGGRLMLTPVLGPVPAEDAPVFALAEGDITIENPETPTKGKIHRGCRLEYEFQYNYVQDGKVTLVLKPQFAEFRVAQEVAYVLNSPQILYQNNSRLVARAIDAVTIEVEIPGHNIDDPVDFIAQLMQLKMTTVPVSPRVVVNERAGVITITGDVEIAPVAIAHRNIMIETGGAGTGSFVALDPADPQNPKLKSLVTSLNAINVPTSDIIEIIKLVNANGALAGDLILK
jgi:flagellar P-ring protein FlgI